MEALATRDVRFTQPDLAQAEVDYACACLKSGDIAGDGPFTQRCHRLLEQHFGAPALLTHSGTAALEMAAILLNLGPGDEVIMPSYTFVSTANAFVLRGAVPVFVDIRPDTLNLDERQIDRALTTRTRAIAPVHYAGVGCEMDRILQFAEANGLKVIEDAAQGYLAAWNGRPLGSLGALGALSFHATKNVVSGEGGLLVVNDPELAQRARIIREKGTNRSDFNLGKVDRYEWLDVGSSFLPSDLIAAILLAQLERAEAITAYRRMLWQRYHVAFQELERQGRLRRPFVPRNAASNAHIYFIVLESPARRRQVQSRLQAAGIAAQTHYVPLHNSPAGRRYGRSVGELPVTESIAETMLRLPLHGGLSVEDVERIADVVITAYTDTIGSET